MLAVKILAALVIAALLLGAVAMFSRVLARDDKREDDE